MKIKCEKSALSTCVNMAAKAVPRETTLSILESILIEAKDGKVTFTANDNDFGIFTSMETEVLEEGKIAIDAKRLCEIVSKLQDGEITIVTEGAEARILCGKAKNKIPCRSGEDYTYLPEIEKKDPIIVSQFTLKEMIKRTVFATGNLESNKIMSGLHMTVMDDKIELTGLDGHRIAIRKSPLRNSHEAVDIIIPGKTVLEVSKIIPGDDEQEVMIYVTDNYIVFSFGDTVITSRLIEGKYFDVNKMINADYEIEIKLNKRELYTSVDASMVYYKEGNKKPIIFNIEGNNLHLELNAQDGKYDNDMDIEHTGSDLRICFDPKYIVDALKYIDDDDIYMQLMNNVKMPLYIRDKEDTYTYVILPINN